MRSEMINYFLEAYCIHEDDVVIKDYLVTFKNPEDTEKFTYFSTGWLSGRSAMLAVETEVICSKV